MTPIQKLAEAVLRDLSFTEKAIEAGFSKEEAKKMIDTAKILLEKQKVVAIVSGGVLQSMFADDPNIEATVIDCDNILEENPEADCDEEITKAKKGLSQIF